MTRLKSQKQTLYNLMSGYLVPSFSPTSFLTFFFTTCNIMNSWKQAVIIPDFSVLMPFQRWFVHGKMLNFCTAVNHLVSQDQTNQINPKGTVNLLSSNLPEGALDVQVLPYIRIFSHKYIKYVPIISMSIVTSKY